MAPRMFVFLALVLAGCGEPQPAKPHPPVTRLAQCPRAQGKIILDGVLDEPAWSRTKPIRDFAVFWQRRGAATTTTARLLWDDDFLYYSAQMQDEDLFALEKVRNGLTWEDDVFELFFKPSPRNTAYYEFQVNALNTHLELYLPSRGAGGYRRFAPRTKLGMESAVKLQGTLNQHEDRDTGWVVEGRIPWSAFQPTGGRPASGTRWRFALCRYDYSVTHEKPELSSTAPLTQMDFHRYEDYGELEFVDRAN